MFDSYSNLIVALLVFFFIFILPLMSKKKKKKADSPASRTISAQKAASKKMSGFAGKELRQELRNTDGSFHDREHTHNRLDSDCYSADTGSLDHYFKQLDSLLKAGIIDRKEYRVLLNRYTNSLR